MSFVGRHGGGSIRAFVNRDHLGREQEAHQSPHLLVVIHDQDAGEAVGGVGHARDDRARSSEKKNGDYLIVQVELRRTKSGTTRLRPARGSA